MFSTLGRECLSREIDLATLKEFLEKEIEELERKLQLYQAILALLNEQLGLRTQRLGRGREFRDSNGRLVAALSHTRDRVILTLYKSVPESDPYMKYALRTLGRLVNESEGLEYSVEKDDDGRIKAIMVLGVTKDNIDDIVATLEYTAMKIASRK